MMCLSLSGSGSYLAVLLLVVCVSDVSLSSGGVFGDVCCY